MQHFFLITIALFISSLSFCQGTVQDIDGNTYNYVSLGNQDWATENLKVTTYSDGTPIPQVTSSSQWENLTTGAWCYLNNNPDTQYILYNFYAVVGVHDNDPNTPNKTLAPDGWTVPSGSDWFTLRDYLNNNGYAWNGVEHWVAKSLASTSGWSSSSVEGAPGNDQSANNTSGLNLSPSKSRSGHDGFFNSTQNWYGNYWTRDGDYSNFNAQNLQIAKQTPSIRVQNAQGGSVVRKGIPVRIVRNNTTASTLDFNYNKTKITPNPTSTQWTINCPVKIKEIAIYDMLGKIMYQTYFTGENEVNIDANNYSSGVYIVKINNSYITRIIKN